MRRLTTLATMTIFGTVIALVPPAPAQDRPESKDRAAQQLADQQAEILREFDKVQKAINQVAERLKRRGDVEDAQRLTEAYKLISDKLLRDDLAKIESLLRNGKTAQVQELQKELLGKLQSVIELLMGKRDPDEDMRRHDELKAAAEKLDQLIKQQKEHRQELDKIEQKAKDEALSEQLKAALKKLQQMRAQQARQLAESQRRRCAGSRKTWRGRRGCRATSTRRTAKRPRRC
ncbi:MAG: coiled-coil domain-containing protein [Planctomycetota bacterium]|jgi:hypothetical protein